MPDPFNYTLANVPNPMQSVMDGFKNSFDIRAMADQQKARTMALQDEELKRKRTESFNNDTYSLYQNPTVDGINKLMLKYPEFASKFDKAREGLTEAQKQANLTKATEAFNAARQGKPEIARDVLLKQAEAARNSGDEQGAKAAEAMAESVVKDRKAFLIPTAMHLAIALGPEKFAQTYPALLGQDIEQDLAPAKLKEQESKATEAAVKAKFAESTAVQDLEKKGWDIQKIQNDIDVSKQNAKIAAANVALSRENNVLKRQELGLKVQEMEAARDEKVRTKSAEYENLKVGSDNFLDTIDKVLSTPKSVIDRATGRIQGSSWSPTIMQSTSDLESTVKTLQSQIFLDQVPRMKSMGQLTEAEGAKLDKALQSIDMTQSSDRFINNIKEIEAIVLKAQRNMASKYGVPYQNREMFTSQQVADYAKKSGLSEEQVKQDIRARGGRVR